MRKYILKIETDSNKLGVRSEEINTVTKATKVESIIKDLKSSLRDRTDAVALCAPQLGHKTRIFCIKFANGDIRAFINPMITKTEGLHLTRETNISLENKHYIVPRHDRIIAIYQTPVGTPEENAFEGVVAEVFQQMVNMLDGVLISDIGLEIDDDFDKATKEEQTEVINAWLDAIKLTDKKLQEEIEADPALSETKKAIEFMTGVATGEVKLEKIETDEPKTVKKPRKKRVSTKKTTQDK